jgi:hypothetical protein
MAAIIDGINASTNFYLFDCKSGKFNFIKSTANNNTNASCAFSPNSRFLYVKDEKEIKQYDLADILNCTNYIPPFSIVNSYANQIIAPIIKGSSIRLGRENRLYANNRLNNTLDLIHFPNNLNTTFNEVGFCSDALTSTGINDADLPMIM